MKKQVMVIFVVALSFVLIAEDTIDALRLKAMDGDKKSMREIGEYYLCRRRQKPPTKNRSEAMAWFEKAAKKKDFKSICYLVTERELPVEREDRLMWLKKLGAYASALPADERIRATVEVADAYMEIGCYTDGTEWILKVVDLLEKDWEGLNLRKVAAVLRGERKELAIRNYPAYIEFLRLAINKDIPRSGDYICNVDLRRFMGEAYENGYGVAQDYGKAFKCYMDALYYAGKHNCTNRWQKMAVGEVQQRIGECYRHGRGCDKNLKLMAHWYEKAGLNGNFKARNQFAEWCLNGLCEIAGDEMSMAETKATDGFFSMIGGEELKISQTIIDMDVNRAEELSDTDYYVASAQDKVVAAYRLCRIYIARNDWGKAVNKLKEWTDYDKNPNRAAMTYMLASAYMLGRGVEKDVSKGRALMKEAAELGNPEAMKCLDKAGISYELK